MPSAVERTAKSFVLERSSLYAEFMSGITFLPHCFIGGVFYLLIG